MFKKITRDSKNDDSNMPKTYLNLHLGRKEAVLLHHQHKYPEINHLKISLAFIGQCTLFGNLYFLRFEILVPDCDMLCDKMSLSVANIMEQRKYTQAKEKDFFTVPVVSLVQVLAPSASILNGLALIAEYRPVRELQS